MFKIMLRQDQEITQRLECTLFWGTIKPTEQSNGTKFHSKTRGHGFANDHFKAFDKRLNDAVYKYEEADKKLKSNK